jgi:hypothetical protein
MKTLLALATLSCLTFASHAKADFINIPFQCSVIPRHGGESQIYVSVTRTDAGIVAVLRDGRDTALLRCERVRAPNYNYHSLKCQGSWKSDGSLAELGTPLDTYVPMTAIRRSAGLRGGELQDGICTEQ